VDTVERAAASPDQPQPWAGLGLEADEYARIREILGRRPTSSELAMYSVMWSEHCSYKSSKVHLRRFGKLSQETPLGKTLAGIGENAGVIDIGQGYAVTFKVESHNHPSYVEPYQGAATGVGGIVRDILAMGARPVAVMDPLRFGPWTRRTPRGCCRGSWPASAATGTVSGCPTSAVRRSSTRRTPAPAGQRPVRRRAAARAAAHRSGQRCRQPRRPVRRPHRR
jgi:phosphoribosylformylglycinamidine synthase